MTQNMTFDIVHTESGAGYNDISAKIDAAGKQFLAIAATPDAANTNITEVDLYMAPAGQPYPQAPDYHFVTPAGVADKIDCVTLERSGSDLLVYAGTHAPGAGNRALHVVGKRLPGVFSTTPQFEQESNGPGADVIPSGGGGTSEVDYARVEAIVNFVVQRELAGLVSLFGGQGIRQGLEDKAKDALVETLTGDDARAQAYKAALYDFVKNANAGVQANILGGQDQWGQARREELKAALREVLEEGMPEES